jgi:hypothetical protein
MLVQEIIDSVKRMLGDESGVQILDTDIFRWINQGMRQIVMQNESLYLTDKTADATKDVGTYSLPTDLLILRSMKYLDSSTGTYLPMEGYDLAKFNAIIGGWDGTQDRGTPYYFTVKDTATVPNKIGVYPIPDISLTNAFKFIYNKTPTAVATGNDTPDIPLLYHEVLIKHCVQQAYELDEDWDAAGNKASELDRDINILRGREDWKSQETYSTITVRPEDL